MNFSTDVELYFFSFLFPTIILDGIILATGCCGAGKKSKCYNPTTTGSPSLCSIGTYDSKCDSSIDAQKFLGKIDFNKQDTYVCGNSFMNDVSLNTIVDLGSCCGANGKSACYKDFSSICEATGTYTPAATILGMPFTCDDAFVAFNAKDFNFTTPDGTAQLTEESSTFVCNTSGLEAATEAANLDMIVATTGCCGVGKHSKCWIDATNNVCQPGEVFLHNHKE